MAKLENRPDIDGLRTIAVLPVVLFHFGFTAFSGGFVGVDVFFVISGYLITRLILNDIKDGTFSFSRFYERRARRLFPAMWVTVAATLLLNQFLLLPDYLREAAGSSVFAVTSLSNVFFWTQSGYFDGDALTKPLLHTWSLSVEEQFYMVWPAALVIFAPMLGRIGLRVALVLVAALSLLAAEYYLDTDSSAVFYLTPFRMFEFVIGASALWFERFVLTRRLLLELAFVTGLALMAYAVFSYTEETPFPGAAALIPCVGAALAIAGGRAPLSGWLVRNPASVWIGKISYSIYLIHWPLAVYFDAYFFREPTIMDQIALLTATFALAALMFIFIETPFRNPPADKRLSAPAFGLACAMLAMLVVLPAATQWASKDGNEFASITRSILSVPAGILGATPAYAQESMITERQLAASESARSELMEQIKCGANKMLCGETFRGLTNVLIIGDSHAPDAYNALAMAYPDLNLLIMKSRGCPPFDEPGLDAGCKNENAERADMVNDMADDLEYIVVHVRMHPKRAPYLAQYVRDLAELGPKIIVSGAGPLYKRPLIDLYRRMSSPSDPLPDFAEYRDDGVYAGDAEVEAAANAVGAVYISRKDYFCPGDVCTDYTVSKQDLVTTDTHHLTLGAAIEFGEYIRETYPDLFESP